MCALFNVVAQGFCRKLNYPGATGPRGGRICAAGVQIAHVDLLQVEAIEPDRRLLAPAIYVIVQRCSGGRGDCIENNRRLFEKEALPSRVFTATEQ